MDVNLCCNLCGFELSADETDGPGAEHLAQLFTAVHTAHTPREVNNFIWANGHFPIGAQRDREDREDEGDGDGGR